MPLLSAIPTNIPLGKFIYDSPLRLHSHEMMTINKLLRFGESVYRLPESNIAGYRSPDIRWRGRQWEIKYLRVDSRKNIRHALQKAKKQSRYIILDIKKSKRPPGVMVHEIYTLFKGYKSVDEVLVIIGNNYCNIT